MSTALLKKSLDLGPAGEWNPAGCHGVHKIEVQAADKM
jgi:hypothetical protein